jgi:hypothetical protein
MGGKKSPVDVIGLYIGAYNETSLGSSRMELSITRLENVGCLIFEAVVIGRSIEGV